jgi:hypothetical protein
MYASSSPWRFWALVVVLGAQIQLSEGLIHRLVIKDDTRHLFQIESFGFLSGGVMNLTVTGFQVLKCSKDCIFLQKYM